MVYRYVNHLQTEKKKTVPYPRIPRPLEDPRRAPRTCPPAQKAPRTPFSVRYMAAMRVVRMNADLFPRVLRRGAIKSPSFSLHCLPLSPGEKSRIAVVVSKRVARTAVGRNALKRRSRELLKGALSRGSVPYALILRLAPTAASRTRRELRTELEKLLSSSGIAKMA